MSHRAGAYRTAPFAVVVLSAAAAFAQAVTFNEYENLDARRALTDTPVTVSRIGAGGDFTQGVTPAVNGRKLPAQVDVLRRGPDGSIRHALVSFVLPALPAGGKVRVDWLNEKPPAPAPFQWAFDRAGLDLKLVLTTVEGTALTSDVGSILAGRWAASRRVKVLRDGPVMKELEIHDVPAGPAGRPDPHIDVFWRIRAFTGESSVRVAAVVESCRQRRRGVKYPMFRKFKSVHLRCGPKVLYEEGPYSHIDQTRYRIVAWTDGPAENIHRRPNYAYWVKGRFVPTYRWTDKTRRRFRNMTPAKVDATFTEEPTGRRKPRRKQGILEHGIIFEHMPRGGSRWDIGPYPAWAVAYLLSGAPETYRRTLHADGNGAGAFYVHARQGKMPGHNVFTVKVKPHDRSFRVSRYEFPGPERPRHEPDHAHAPALGYISYLLTGDRYYAEELSFWASYHMGECPHKGLRWRQMDRSCAWSTRQVVDAAFILPDDHPLRTYYRDGVNRMLDQMSKALLKSPKRVHSPPDSVFRSSGRFDWINCKRSSAWMYSWVVWTLGNAADKGFAKARPLADWAAEYIVGFYTSDDEFKAPDGKVYKYDPRDAMPYSTATQLWDYEIVPQTVGGRTIRRAKLTRKIKNLDNYGEIWYWTKVNSDNMYSGSSPTGGVKTSPNADGVWPLRADGWGRGMYNWGTQKRWWAWHRYGAWVGLVTAREGNVPKAHKAWEVMTSLAGPAAYGYEMVPRGARP